MGAALTRSCVGPLLRCSGRRGPGAAARAAPPQGLWRVTTVWWWVLGVRSWHSSYTGKGSSDLGVVAADPWNRRAVVVIIAPLLLSDLLAGDYCGVARSRQWSLDTLLHLVITTSD